jgi:hypothetical protein
MNAITLGFVVKPLSYIRFILDALPNSIALLDASCPFTIVDLSISPCINAFSMGFARLVMTLKKVSRCKKFVASTMPLVSIPFTFIYSTFFSVN